jgi:hypothetical protein
MLKWLKMRCLYNANERNGSIEFSILPFLFYSKIIMNTHSSWLTDFSFVSNSVNCQP